MKVCTDACVLGAYAMHPNPGNILDIGTGTGLLAMMLAQRYPKASIQALEIESQAGGQAKENFRNSPWAERLELIQMAVQNFCPIDDYDMIVCNPPFYRDHLRPMSPLRSGARHATWLSFSELTAFVGRHLRSTGRFWVLLPPSELLGVHALAQIEGLWVSHLLEVRNRAHTRIVRNICCYSRDDCTQPIPVDKLAIRDNLGRYSSGMTRLLKPFYLEYNFAY